MALHCAIVLGMAGKYAYDRERLPRVWVKCAPVDPNMPVRGRYLSLRLEVGEMPQKTNFCRLAINDGRIICIPADHGLRVAPGTLRVAALTEAVPYFIPEHAQDPSRLKSGQELWVEVSLPGEGLPRPLRLQVR